MASPLTLHARAKINLHLRVLGRLPSGYHAVETLYHSVGLADTLTFERADVGIALTCDDAAIPLDGTNLVARAASAFFSFTGIAGGLKADIVKRIPSGAGLGGGSADAAATLVALNRLYGTRYPAAILERLGAAVGADVPFCVRGGAAWGVGTGTVLTPLAPATSARILLVNPGIHVDTAWAYGALKADSAPGFRLTAGDAGARILRAWDGLDSKATPEVTNTFEAPVFAAHPTVRDIRERLRSCGGSAMMTGSGSTVFGVFRDDASLARARHAVGDQPFVAVTTLAGRGVVEADSSEQLAGR
jgi:4-diphosphocytidyl-2-C-methyl-D-erythritol kinase